MTDTCPACGSYRPGYPFTPEDPCLNCKEREERRQEREAREGLTDDRLRSVARSYSDAEVGAMARELLAARRVIEAQAPLMHYLKMRDAKPMRGMADVIHGLHSGTEWEAEITVSDLRTIASALAAYDEVTR